MQRQVLSTYNLILARKLNSSPFNVVQAGVKWVRGNDAGFTQGRKCSLRTLAIGNNSATAIALSHVKTTDSKIVSKDLRNTTNTEPEEFELEEMRNDEILERASRKHRRNIPIVPSTLDTQIQDEKDVQKLLQVSLSPGLTLRGACQLIFRLGQLVQDKTLNISPALVQNDDRFKGLCKLIQNGNHSQVPHSLLQGIQGLQNLGLTPKEYPLMQELENELKWSLRRCPVKFLARAIEILSQGKMVEVSTPENSEPSKVHPTGGTQAQDPLYAAIQTLQRRWTEVTTGGDFLVVFKVINYLAVETREKLEDRAVELVQDFSPLEMVKMFTVLASQKRRPTPLLRALAFHLSKSTEKVPVKDLVELVYALNELTFAETVLMQKICTDIQAEVETIKNPSWISSLATSLGRMRYLHKELIESMEDWISKHLEELRPFDCASWLLASSVFYLNSSRQEQFFAKAKLKLCPEEVQNPLEWLNIVHALVILDQATPDLVSSVLKPEFVSKIDTLNQSNSAARLKLLNVNAFTRSGNLVRGESVSKYNGPQLSKEFVSKWASSTGENDLHLSKIVLESLSNFLPPPKYLHSGVKSDSGVFIDAVCVLNEKTDPVPIDSSNIKGAMKVAILVQGYPVLCLGVKVPTGSSVLNVKLLQSEGYRVMTVPYSEFSPKDKILRRVQYLEQKVRNINSSDNDKDANLQLQNR